MNILITTQVKVLPPPKSVFDFGGGQGGGQILELHKSRAGAKAQSELDVYEWQIKSVAAREAIDGLVYELSPEGDNNMD